MATIIIPTLRAKIKTILEGITEIQEIHSYPTTNFGGYPACVIDFINIASDIETQKENLRVYNFIIHIFYESDKTTRMKAVQVIEDVGEKIVDTFESDEFLSGITLPAGKQMINVRPATNPIEISEDKWIRGEVILPIRISFDTTI